MRLTGAEMGAEMAPESTGRDGGGTSSDALKRSAEALNQPLSRRFQLAYQYLHEALCYKCMGP